MQKNAPRTCRHARKFSLDFFRNSGVFSRSLCPSEFSRLDSDILVASGEEPCSSFMIGCIVSAMAKHNTRPGERSRPPKYIVISMLSDAAHISLTIQKSTLGMLTSV